MSSGLRKFVLSAHLAVSVGWIGAVVAYLVLGLAAEATRDPQTVRAAWIAMELTGWYAIVPLALASLVTGVVVALGTKWGLLRHYWVVFSLALTSFATIVLLFHMPTVSSGADVARDAEDAILFGLGGDLGHPAIGLAVLLVILLLNMYKPQGLTPFGHRKQLDERQPERRSKI
jgi:hypothetical protein